MSGLCESLPAFGHSLRSSDRTSACRRRTRSVGPPSLTRHLAGHVEGGGCSSVINPSPPETDCARVCLEDRSSSRPLCVDRGWSGTLRSLHSYHLVPLPGNEVVGRIGTNWAPAAHSRGRYTSVCGGQVNRRASCMAIRDAAKRHMRAFRAIGGFSRRGVGPGLGR